MLTLKLSDMVRCEGGETDNGSCYKFKIPLLGARCCAGP